MELATNPHKRESTDFQVKVGRIMSGGDSQKFVNSGGHWLPFLGSYEVFFLKNFALEGALSFWFGALGTTTPRWI